MVFVAEACLAEGSDVVLVLAGTRVGDMGIGSCGCTVQFEGDIRIYDSGGRSGIIDDDRIDPDSSAWPDEVSELC